MAWESFEFGAILATQDSHRHLSGQKAQDLACRDLPIMTAVGRGRGQPPWPPWPWRCAELEMMADPEMAEDCGENSEFLEAGDVSQLFTARRVMESPETWCQARRWRRKVDAGVKRAVRKMLEM